MRIRLKVQRQGIPPVQILWNVTARNNTISEFLLQINEIIPLEHGEWGLEDYAVEVQGYECLHYSELKQVFQQDDEVSIRPLQTTDLRVRRISGRHQISSDGKHLIDGVAFGRPYLRRAERPAVRIAPRKRRRLIYDKNEDEDADESGGPNDGQIVLRTSFVDADESHSDNETDDGNDSPDTEDLVSEIEALQDELHPRTNENQLAVLGSEVPSGRRSTRRRTRTSREGLGLLELTEGDDQSTAVAYTRPQLDDHKEDEGAPTRPADRKRKRHSISFAQGPAKGVSRGARDQLANPTNDSRRNSAGSNKSVRFEDIEMPTPATIQEFSDSEEDDDDFDPSDVDESDKENARPPAEEASSSNESLGASESSSTSSVDTDSDETSSSGSSSSGSGSDSDSEPEQLSAAASSRKPESSRTSSTTSSLSSSDLKPEKEPQGEKQKVLERTTESQMPNRNHRGRPPIIDRITESQMPNRNNGERPPIVPPGQGKRKTQARNQRRRKLKALAHLKREGVLAAGATVADMLQYTEGRPTNFYKLDREERRQKLESADLTDAFNAKKQALLTAIAGQGVNMSSTPDVQEDQPATPGINEQQPERQEDVQMADSETLQNQENELSRDEIPQQEQMTDVPTIPFDSQEAEEKVSPGKGTEGTVTARNSTPNQTVDHTPGLSSLRKSKLDLSGAKRMLFGSLGLRTPKTKQDELETREKLMKDVRPIKAVQPEEKVETLEEIAADDSWKEKIDYRAVECYDDGIRLTTPPFPFVQRWDPQQQRGCNGSNTQKRKGKKRKRNNNSYYENNDNDYYEDNNNSYYEDSSYQDSLNKVVRLNEYESIGDRAEFLSAENNADIQEEEHLHDSFDQSFQDSQAVNEQILRESGEITAVTPDDSAEPAEDLPDIPEDPSNCPFLTREASKQGTIIAFKQLEMSAETNWQPKISDYRTAMVDGVKNDGTLQMTPAKRDRPERQFKYDEDTGERLYDKFEMPGYDDDDDDDKLEISFDELISPIILRDARNDYSYENGQQHSVDVSIMKANEILDGQKVDLDGAADIPIEPSKEKREEISELIRDAGWRSSVQSEVNRDLYSPEPQGLIEKKDDHVGSALPNTPSPRFNGFSSSPLVNVRSSPPVSDEPTPKHILASGTEIAESVPRQDPDTTSATSDIKSVVDYPNLPEVCEDSEPLQDEAQQRSDPPIDHTSLSQDFISNGIDHSPVHSTPSRIKLSQEKSSPPPFKPLNNATDSEDEFPEVFSQAWENRMSQEVDIKPEISQESVISPPSWRRSRLSSQRESNRSWKPDGVWSAFEEEGQEQELQEDNNDEVEDGDDDDAASTPRPSQQLMSTHIVDLTQFSDDVDATSKSVEDEDSYKLPKGPGWVKKTRKSRERSESVQAGAGKAKTKRR